MKIQGFEDVIKIKSFQIVSKINEHSLCNFCAVIDENKIGFYVNLAMNRTESEVKSEDNILLLKGLVNEINVIYSESETNIEVTIISSSILAEENIPEKIRVFQNTSKTAKDIIDYINNHGTYKFELKKADKLNNKIPHIIVQDNISDFEFVKNICADYNYGLIPDVSNNKIIIGESTGNLSVSIDEDYSEKIISIEGIYSRDNSSVKFRSMKKIDPGTVVCINSSGKNFSAFLNLKKYIITEVTVTEEYESVYFDYNAVEKPDYSEYKADDRFVSVFNAEVTDNNDPENKGRVQVHFCEVEDETLDNRIWIDYLSGYVGEKNTGIKMIPDIKDTVKVILSKQDVFIAGSLRKSSIPEKYAVVSDKSVIYGDDKYITFNNDKIEMSFGEEKSMIYMDDRKLDLFFGKEKSMIHMDDNKLDLLFDKDENIIHIDQKEINLLLGESNKVVIDKDKISGLIEQNKSSFTADKNKVEINANGSNFLLEKNKAAINTGQTEVLLNGSDVSISGVNIKLKT